jgi:O-antigen/teichoic acid export membrane protein
MSSMTTLVARLRSGFLGDVLKLSFGTLAGRLISLIALPVVTRLYSPEDFALLAIYLALMSPLAVAACLRLEIAIPLVETEREAADLLTLALAVLALVTALLMLPALLMPGQVASALGAPALAPYVWLVPLGVAMAGSYSALQAWATRARRFGAIARTRVGQAVAGVSAMVSLGWAGVAPFGLLLGNMFNIGAGGVSLAASALVRDGAMLRAVRLRNLAPAFRRNRRYPLFSTPEALFNVAGVQVPVLLVAAYAGAEAGFLLLAMQVMSAPMNLLGSSISQVYVSRAPTEYREGRLAPFTLAIMRRLLLVGVGPLILAGALAPVVFPPLFGPEWARAGEIVTWLVPWMALQFIASPVSMVLHMVGRQNWAMYLQTAGLAIRGGGVLLAIKFSTDPVVAFALASAAFYAFYSCVVIVAARSKMST